MASDKLQMAYLFAVVLYLLFGAPALMGLPRWWRAWRTGAPLIPTEFRDEKSVGYRCGYAFAWLGNAATLLTAGAIAIAFATGSLDGAPLGMGFGLGLLLYIASILSIEINVLQWKPSAARQPSDRRSE